mmetsp:Transcript_24402/g.48822  ORF Transcript_24402/g.48822 Transcript_24402/m.48822 type:complete len:211 (-) Transcript_24402:104-736(-)
MATADQFAEVLAPCPRNKVSVLDMVAVEFLIRTESLTGQCRQTPCFWRNVKVARCQQSCGPLPGSFVPMDASAHPYLLDGQYCRLVFVALLLRQSLSQSRGYLVVQHSCSQLRRSQTPKIDFSDGGRSLSESTADSSRRIQCFLVLEASPALKRLRKNSKIAGCALRTHFAGSGVGGGVGADPDGWVTGGGAAAAVGGYLYSHGGAIYMI